MIKDQRLESIVKQIVEDIHILFSFICILFIVLQCHSKKYLITLQKYNKFVIIQLYNTLFVVLFFILLVYIIQIFLILLIFFMF